MPARKPRNLSDFPKAPLPTFVEEAIRDNVAGLRVLQGSVRGLAAQDNYVAPNYGVLWARGEDPTDKEVAALEELLQLQLEQLTQDNTTGGKQPYITVGQATLSAASSHLCRQSLSCISSRSKYTCTLKGGAYKNRVTPLAVGPFTKKLKTKLEQAAMDRAQHLQCSLGNQVRAGDAGNQKEDRQWSAIYVMEIDVDVEQAKRTIDSVREAETLQNQLNKHIRHAEDYMARKRKRSTYTTPEAFLDSPVHEQLVRRLMKLTAEHGDLPPSLHKQALAFLNRWKEDKLAGELPTSAEGAELAERIAEYEAARVAEKASRFRGVTKMKGRKAKPWAAKIGVTVDGKPRVINIGTFAREEDAARSFDRVKIAKVGHAQAETNFPVADYREEWAQLEALGVDGAVAREA